MWSGADRTVIVCGCAPRFFGGCFFESGTGESYGATHTPTTVLDER